jgi:hypothetical protein
MRIFIGYRGSSNLQLTGLKEWYIPTPNVPVWKQYGSMEIYMLREGWDPINRFNHGDIYVKRGLGSINRFNHGDLYVKRRLGSH